MLSRSLRDLTADERRILESCAVSRRFGFDQAVLAIVFPFFVVFMVATTIGAVLAALHWLDRETARSSEYVGAVLGLIASAYFVFRGWSRSGKLNEMYAEDVQAGKVEVLRCRVRAVVEIEEFEDEGPGFFIDCGEPGLLFLQGQYLYDPVEDKQFPNSEFEVVQAPKSKLNLGITCLGQPLAPERKRQMQWGQDYYPDDLELVPATLETLDKDLVRLKREGRGQDR